MKPHLLSSNIKQSPAEQDLICACGVNNFKTARGALSLLCVSVALCFTSYLQISAAQTE